MSDTARLRIDAAICDKHELFGVSKNIRAAADEIDRLRAAMEKISDRHGMFTAKTMREIAREALKDQA